MIIDENVQYVFLIGAKLLGAYGGYETFINKLTEYHKDEKRLKYYVACKVNGSGCMDEKNPTGVTPIKEFEFEYHNAHCFKIPVPNIGPAVAVYYDVAALRYCCEYTEKNRIEHPIVYILACRIGSFMGAFKG